MNSYILKAAGLSADELATIERYASIEQRLVALDREVSAETQRHQDAMAAIRVKRLQIRQECDHPREAITYHPSEGSDGFECCEICDAQAKHLREVVL